MGLFIEIGGFALCRLCCLQNSVQQGIHTRIQLFHGHGTVLDGCDQLPCTVQTGSGHFQVGAGSDALHVIVGSAPVSYHHAVVFPVAPEDIDQKVSALIGIGAVDLVVGSHDGLYAAFFDSDLELGQIELAQSPFIHHSVDCHTALLLGVDREVFCTGAYALALHAFDITRGDLACQIGVFGIILEIAAAERTSLHIHAGAKKDLHVLYHGLLSQGPADLLRQIHIPAGCDRCRRRNTGSGKGRIQSQVISCACLSAHAAGAVGKIHFRNTESGEIPCLPFSFAAHKRGLFLQRHPVDDVFMFHTHLLNHVALSVKKGDPLFTYQIILTCFLLPLPRSAQTDSLQAQDAIKSTPSGTYGIPDTFSGFFVRAERGAEIKRAAAECGRSQALRSCI